MLNKLWIGTTGDYSLYTNWQKVSIRNSGWTWTASGSGTNEYYLRLAGNTNPNLNGQPSKVFIGGVEATEATVGSLANTNWDYGDNDTLGYNTIYIRLNAGDPDSQALDYVQLQGIPVATDNVRIPRGTGVISSGLDQSAVAIGDFIVDDGYSNTIASSAAYLKIDPDRFIYSGTGEAWINLGTAAIAADVLKTATAQVGYAGLYLLGSALTVVSASGRSSVGLAYNPGETSTVTAAIRTTGVAKVHVGNGVTLTGTSVDMLGGEIYTYSSIAAAQLLNGILTLLGTAAATGTVEVRGGTFMHNSTGTVTLVQSYSGTSNWQESGLARIVTDITYYGGTLLLNPYAVTYTNKIAFPESIKISA